MIEHPSAPPTAGRAGRRRLLLRAAVACALGCVAAVSPVAAGAPFVALSGEVVPHDDPESTRQIHADVGVLANGDFLVVWEEGYQSSETEGPGGGAFVNSRRFTSTGTPVGGEAQVNTYTLHSQEDPAIAVAPDGSFQVVWRTRGFVGEQGTYNIMGRGFDSAGAPVGDDFLVSSYDGRQGDPDLAHLGDGRFVVVWEGATNVAYDSRDIQMRICTAGCPGSEPHLQINTYTTAIQVQPRVAARADGSFVVVWSSFASGYADTTIRARRFDSSGTPLDPSDVVVNTSTGIVRWPDVTVLSNDQAVVVWQGTEHPETESSDELLRGRRYGADGAPIGGDFAVSLPESGRQRYGRLVATPHERYVVVWENGAFSDVVGRQFLADGTPVGSEVILTEVDDFNQERPTIAFDPSGSLFGVAWQTDHLDGSRDVRARAFVLGPHPTLVFADGFESGAVTAWD